MKSLLRFVVVVCFLLPVPLAAVQGPHGEKGEFSEEQKSDMPAPEIKIFTRRYLKLKNATSEKVSAEIVYRTYLNEAWVWQPADPGGDTLAVEIEPGETVQVQANDMPITASRIRIWGSSRSFKWDNNRANDLWTVPEIDMKEHRYSATEMDTFNYTFSAPDGADRGVGEPADPSTMESKGEPSSETARAAPAPFTPSEGETTTIGNNSAIAGGDNTPITGGGYDDGGGGFGGGGASGGISDAGPGGVGGGGISLPGGLGGILDKFLDKFKDKDGKEQLTGTDLAATNFKLTATGDFTGTVENLGAEEFTSGREWFVLKSKTGKVKGFDKALAKGAIDAIPAGGKFDVKGKIPGFTTTAFYVLVISPGDKNKKNDSSNVLQFTPTSSKSDLSVKLTLTGDKLEGVITNEGPEDFKEGSRTFKLAEKTGTVPPREGKVPDLKKGETTKFGLKITPDVKGLNTKFFLTVNAGDEKPANDFAEVTLKGTKLGPDLEAKSLKLIGDILEGVIVNNGPGDYKGGRSYFLGNKDANKSDAITEIKQGATRNVAFLVPKDVLAKPQTFKLNISEIDGKPGNDSVSLSNKAGNMTDLAVTLKLEGNEIKAKITNVGKTTFDGKSRTFKLFHDKETYLQGSILKKLNPGESRDITHTLSKNAPAQVIVLELSKGDDNVANDKAEVKFLATKVDLSVKMQIVGSMAKVIVTNLSAEVYPGKRTFTFKRDGLTDINGDVAGPIQPNNQRTITFDLGAMKPGNVKFSLVNTDPNPANDSATAVFKSAAKGFELRITKADFIGKEFVITVANTGLTPFPEGNSYTITGPGGFKISGKKIPAIDNAKTRTFTHETKVTPPAGAYQVVLEVKDSAPKDNTFKFNIAPIELHLTKAEFAKGFFAFSVVNKGVSLYPGKDTFTITGPGGFKQTGEIPPVAGQSSTNFTRKPMTPPPTGAYEIVLNIKDSDPKGNTLKFNVGPAQGFDLRVTKAEFAKGLFAFTFTNEGGDPYLGGHLYTVEGPGGFKDTDKIPVIDAGKSATFGLKPKTTPAAGDYKIVLNVKDSDTKDNTFNFKVVAPPKAVDLAVSNLNFNEKTQTFSFKVTNQGDAGYTGKNDTTLTGPGGFKEAGPTIPDLAAGASSTLSHKAIAKVAKGEYKVTLNVKDADPKNQSTTLGILNKGVDFAVSDFTFNAKTNVFAFKITYLGTSVMPDKVDATITGPGGFKETVPVPKFGGDSAMMSHKAIAKVLPGTYTVTLNLKDVDPTNQTATVKVGASKGVDLAISNLTYDAKTQVFAFKVTNQGGADYLLKDSTTITAPGGFVQAGPTIPNLAGGASTTLTHKMMGKVPPGTYTVTLNVKDTDASNQTATVKVAPPVVAMKAELIIAGLSRKGGNWTVTIQNIGAGAYSSADGVKLGSRYVKKGASTKLNPDVAVPNIAAGGSITLPARPDPVGYAIEAFLHDGGGISPDPAKTKVTSK